MWKGLRTHPGPVITGPPSWPRRGKQTSGQGHHTQNSEWVCRGRLFGTRRDVPPRLISVEVRTNGIRHRRRSQTETCDRRVGGPAATREGTETSSSPRPSVVLPTTPDPGQHDTHTFASHRRGLVLTLDARRAKVQLPCVLPPSTGRPGVDLNNHFARNVYRVAPEAKGRVRGTVEVTPESYPCVSFTPTYARSGQSFGF